MQAPPVSARRLAFGATLRNLWELIGLSGKSGRWLVLNSVALAAVAATIDAASFALLRNTLGGRAGGDLELKYAVAFLCVAVVGSVVRLAAQRRVLAAQFEVGRTMSLRAFSALQRQSYAEYLRRGASDGFTAFERLVSVLNFGVSSLIAGAAALLAAVVILLGIGLLHPLAAALMALTLPALALEAIWRGRRAKNGGLSALMRERSQLLYEARSGFRHIFMANGQQRILEDFSHAETRYRREHARTMFASQSSRYTIELAGLLAALAILAFYALSPPTGMRLVPFLAVVALATFRLLPQIAALRTAIQMITDHADVTNDVRALVVESVRQAAPPPAGAPVQLHRALMLDDVTLSRPDRPVTLDRLSLEIPRGMRVGIMGESGTGKSSLLDVLCGAIAPDSGAVRIDDVLLGPDNGAAWRNRIGVVSQNPVLLGATLREAVVFPQRFADADPARFAMALHAAGVEAMVAGFPLGLETPVGEASSLLSGGQRQRLALAHALYRANDLLVLDEATGQLDPDSEALILAAVQALPRDLTIVVASHRAAVFACCDVVYRLSGGKLATVG